MAEGGSGLGALNFARPSHRAETTVPAPVEAPPPRVVRGAGTDASAAVAVAEKKEQKQASLGDPDEAEALLLEMFPALDLRRVREARLGMEHLPLSRLGLCGARS